MFVRWDTLRIDTEPAEGEAATLPGYRDDAVVRRFDAPEALETRFYEVRSKSVLNRVPAQSRMPFKWTINPYRGCSHACTYCLSPDTPVLMADGWHERIADLEAGDRIVGTERRGPHRHFVDTEVLAKWNTTKPAFRIVLADGTELVASGDHRFLSDRGWKHVVGAEQGPLQRPHLTHDSSLVGTGAFAEGPRQDADYRRGYLCGLIRGDGTTGHREFVAPGRTGSQHPLRSAPTDEPALLRARGFLRGAAGVLPLHAFASSGRPAQLIRTQEAAGVEAVEAMIRWPLSPPDSWRKGFLAGIFDAEGSRSDDEGAQGDHVLRVADTDELVMGWTMDCLRHLGFDAVTERAVDDALRMVRLRGGLVEHLRFLHTVDPAIRRTGSIAGQAVKTNTNLGVVSIEPLGPMRLCDITTGTGDFIANGVVSHNCFARPTHKYLGWDAGRDFEKEIVVKVNAPEVVRAELRRPSWAREHVALGTNTDPYQWVESKYRLMPGIWEALRDARTPASVLTKSPLLLRDIALMREIAEVASFTANLSIPTLEKKAWRDTEPHTPNPRARLEAVAELNRNGIPTGILIAPLMPGINDDPRQVEELLAAAADAGATGISGVGLHLRGEVRGVFMDWLRSQRPDLVPLYEELYASGAYAPAAERRRLAALLRTSGAAPAAPFSRDPDFHQRNVGPAPVPDAQLGFDARGPEPRAGQGGKGVPLRDGAGGTRGIPEERAAPTTPRRPTHGIQKALF